MEITREFIEKLPKSDLHVHLDGSLRLETLIDLAKRKSIELPSYSIEGLRELVFKDQYRNLGEYLTGFGYTTAVMQDVESLERVAYELAEDCADEGIRYLEVRFAPQLHVHQDMQMEDVLVAVNDGLARFAASFNCRVGVVTGEEPPFRFGIICCAMRMFDSRFSTYYQRFGDLHHFSPQKRLYRLASEELAMAVVQIRDQKGLPIVGFDLAGQEAGYPAEDHRSAYHYAHRHFLKKTVHAGEAYGPESIFQAITDLYADRIGHGYHLYSTDIIANSSIQDKDAYVQELANFIADRRITLEVCLTSNCQTMPELKRLEDHSLKKFLKHNLSISLCTDNRTVSNTTITREIGLAVEHFDVGVKRLKDIIIYGFKRSFFPGSYTEKREYVRQIIDYYEKLEREESLAWSRVQAE
ncbi:adenosine deaminase family protein [bacterium]|nr:adenosine deaminase family protein [candidate division CSSED10-310 bacterium]